MDRRDVAAALSRAGLREYEIPGVHELEWRPSEFPYLRLEDGEWAVGICERGTYTAIRRFPREDEACGFLYALLTPAPPPAPAELGEEESCELIAGAEENQRAAWEAYRRARGEHGPRD
jgi:hypothetical protein